MGWLWGSAEGSKSNETTEVPQAPDRVKRAMCWDARDKYFKCLDKHDILDAIKDSDKAEKNCSTEGKAFEENCAQSWVRHATHVYTSGFLQPYGIRGTEKSPH